jgi:hypothetical protein
MAQSFTLDQANHALVFVRPILEDIQNIWHELRKLKIEEKPDEDEIHIRMEKIEHFIEELQQVGCILKDLERGIIDFPSYFKDQPIYLCWRLGEEKIDHWHSINTNYRSRHEIDEEFLQFNSAEANSPVFVH